MQWTDQSSTQVCRFSIVVWRKSPWESPHGRLVNVARLWISNPQQTLRLVVDLQRRVIDLEAFREQTFVLTPDRVAVVAGTDKNVRRERRETGRDRPHVQVVHDGHARVLGERVANFGHAHP